MDIYDLKDLWIKQQQKKVKYNDSNDSMRLILDLVRYLSDIHDC